MKTGQASNSTTFRGGRAPGPNDVFIAVMGVTGSGKSSFISICSKSFVRVGHQLEACTTTVDVYAYEMSPWQTVYLIDTPGFDDTNRSDTEVLREIAGWLGASYKSNILLHGIIYLHRITDIRMQGSARKNLIMFRQLCGEDALKKVILVTTMWDKVPADEAARREKELIETPEFWGWMIGKGSTFHRHNNTEASARGIVSSLAGHKAPIATDLQKQLVDENKSLDQTSAGQELQSEMLKEKAKWDRERREIEEHLKEAIQQRDREAEEMMREERDRYTKMIQKVENDTGMLRSTMNSLLAERDKRVERMEQQMREQQATYEAEIKRLTERQARIEKEKEELEWESESEDDEDEDDYELSEEEEESERENDHHQKEGTTERQPLTHLPGASSTRPIPWTVAIANGNYTCVGPKFISSNREYPKRQLGSAYLHYVSNGDLDTDNCRTWIASYSDGTWATSADFDKVYPVLDTWIFDRGLNELELCCLGPSGRFFARWRDGSWRCRGPEAINAAINKAERDGYHIKAMALGYGDSYIISYAPKSSTRAANWSTSWNLDGHYKELNVENLLRTTSIYAVTLDMHNGTDYALVYTRDEEDNETIWFNRFLGDKNAMLEDISHWWREE
ncbi:uncharacterized protein BDV17DRAFT_291906 [Aspergillus undulatus]|uniref:uncharacterized protein n=1 Tax=Aspergillus undulatus TaxID=1810928 RepID=UPI003CCCC4E7